MKQKPQIIVLSVLALIAAAIWYANFRKRPVATQASTTVPSFQPLSIGNQRIRWDKLDASRATDYTRTVRNIFSEVAPRPEPVKSATPVVPQHTEPVVPTVTPLPVKFFGYGAVPIDGVRLAFFTNGEEVYIVGEGEVLLGRFRVLRVGNNSLEYEDISSHLRGTSILEEQGPSA